jgi:D-lactate dehydrogenase (cytochrome)
VPTYRLPDLKKISAGYHVADPLDLVDLFVGSEGTLGVLTAVTLDLVPLPAAVITGLAFTAGSTEAIALAGALRETALRGRGGTGREGPDVRAIEFADEHCLELLREHGDAARLRIDPPSPGAAVLFEIELPEPCPDDRFLELLEAFLEGDGTSADGPLPALFDILSRHGVLDTLQVALPGDGGRRAALLDFRESVPRRINEILGARRRRDPEIHKVGGDLIVPFPRLAEAWETYVGEFRRRGLEFAIWGHLSDGNLHPNVLPSDAEETRSGERAQLLFGDRVAEMGGSPLSEHGVGRSPLKQELLRRFLGDEALRQMRAVKAALDPSGRFAPGVLFPPG